MRLLHTSDWHLGTSIEQVGCEPEHDRFLDWLVETLDERDIDVLVVAGDVFHHQNPGNLDQRRYYDFLVDCAGLETLRKVVVVAGNHDSPSGLEAPRELLEVLDVHVVGDLPRDEADRGECLIPVTNDAGEVELVVAAVPYVQEARLGISLGDGGESELRRQYRDAFAELYTALADRAEKRWPEASLVTTGHMTVYGEGDEKKAGDFHTAIHRTGRPTRETSDDSRDNASEPTRIGTIEAMDPDIFDARFDYVALGHIHRPMPVGGRRHIRYSGTPVATSLAEDTPPRRVVEIEPGADGDDELPIEMVEVPKWREILELEPAPMDELKSEIAELKRDAALPPALYLTVELPTDEVARDRLGALQEVLDEHYCDDWRPLIVEVQEDYADASEDDDSGRDHPSIDEMSHRDVFEAMYRRQNPEAGEPPGELVSAFDDIVQEVIDTDDGLEGGS